MGSAGQRSVWDGPVGRTRHARRACECTSLSLRASGPTRAMTIWYSTAPTIRERYGLIGSPMRSIPRRTGRSTRMRRGERLTGERPGTGAQLVGHPAGRERTAGPAQRPPWRLALTWQAADRPHSVRRRVAATRGVIQGRPSRGRGQSGVLLGSRPRRTPRSVLEVSASWCSVFARRSSRRGWCPTPPTMQAITTEHVARHVISVDVNCARRPAISGAHHHHQLDSHRRERRHGLRRRSPRNDAPRSHGFWQSAAHITSPAQRIEFRYDPRNPHRDGNGQWAVIQPPMTARDTTIYR